MYPDQEELKNVFKEVISHYIHPESFQEEVAQKMWRAYEDYRKNLILEIAKDLHDRADRSSAVFNTTIG